MSDYWKRRNEEMKHIQSMFNTDAEYNKAIKDIYARTQNDILKEIDAELMRYADREGLSISEARQRVSKMDVEAFKDKAKQYVKEKNFSERANEELRAYNVKMRMNRLQMLNERIRLESIALADAEEKLLYARLDEEAFEEVKRQAGILGGSVPSGAVLNRSIKAIIESDFKGAKFSDRIWSNQADLQRELERIIERTMIQGEHPRVGARKLREFVNKEVNNKRYAAERIAITESARVQTGAQKLAFEEFDIKKTEWIAEPNACPICADMDGKLFNVVDINMGSVTIPAHPNCRCSFSAAYDRDAWDKSLKARGL